MQLLESAVSKLPLNIQACSCTSLSGALRLHLSASAVAFGSLKQQFGLSACSIHTFTIYSAAFHMVSITSILLQHIQYK